MLGDGAGPAIAACDRPSPPVVGSTIALREPHAPVPPPALPAWPRPRLLAAAGAARADPVPVTPAAGRSRSRLEASKSEEPAPVRFDGRSSSTSAPASPSSPREVRAPRHRGPPAPGRRGGGARDGARRGRALQRHLPRRPLHREHHRPGGGGDRRAAGRLGALPGPAHRGLGEALPRERAPGALVRSAIVAASPPRSSSSSSSSSGWCAGGRAAGSSAPPTAPRPGEHPAPRAHHPGVAGAAPSGRRGGPSGSGSCSSRCSPGSRWCSTSSRGRGTRPTAGSGSRSARSGSVTMRVVRFLPNLVYIVLFCLRRLGPTALNAIFFGAVGAGRHPVARLLPGLEPGDLRLVCVFIYGLVAVADLPVPPGSGSSAFQAIGIFFGAMISLGSGSSVANAVSGVVLTYMRPFAVGDFVSIADTTGTVKRADMLAVRLLTIRNETVTIPASMVLAAQILNYSDAGAGTGRRLATSVTIGYDTPWRKVHELLLAAAEKTSSVQATPKPWVIQTALNDFYVRYELDAYIDDPARQHFILSELNQNVQDVFFRGRRGDPLAPLRPAARREQGRHPGRVAPAPGPATPPSRCARRWRMRPPRSRPRRRPRRARGRPRAASAPGCRCGTRAPPRGRPRGRAPGPRPRRALGRGRRWPRGPRGELSRRTAWASRRGRSRASSHRSPSEPPRRKRPPEKGSGRRGGPESRRSVPADGPSPRRAPWQLGQPARA